MNNIKASFFIDKGLANKKKPIIAAIVCPYKDYFIDSIIESINIGIIDHAILIGDNRINDLINIDDKNKIEVINTNTDIESVNKSIELFKEKKVSIIIKGLVESSLFLKRIISKENNMLKSKLLSHCCVSYNENYSNYYLITDAVVNIKPNLNNKIDIIKNAVSLAHLLGIEKPRVANLCAIEKLNEKMQDTIDATKINEMYKNNEFENCIISGPLQIDNAISSESANIKSIDDDVSGKSNILMCPNIESANILSKALVYLSNWSFCGVLVGTKCPIVLNSRACSKKDMIVSIAIATLML